MTDAPLLSRETLETILAGIPRLRIGVIGDLFLDRYLDLDASLTTKSLETGLDAYRVAGVRSIPGAAGTVINNLVALGVGRLFPIALVGDDGEGYELRQALTKYGVVDLRGLLTAPERRTPTYVKPLLHQDGSPPRELNRLDILNRTPISGEDEERLETILRALWPSFDGLVVLDQVSEAGCGVITPHVRERIGELASQNPSTFVLADSRERIGLFRGVSLKPNRREALRATQPNDDVLERAAVTLARQTGRSVFCTDGANGIFLVSVSHDGLIETQPIPAYPVDGPLDIVGAGDSASAAIVCARTTGVDDIAAAAFGNLVASVTVQQIGTTGTATPSQLRERWHEVYERSGTNSSN